MLRGPDATDRVASTYAAYMTGVAESLGLTGVDELPSREVAGLDLGNLATRAASVVVESRQLLEVNEAAMDTLFRSFIPAVIDARQAAQDIALTQGEFTPTDEESLANVGKGLEGLKDYLVPFVLPKDASLPDDVPPISIGTILRMKGMGMNGKDGYVSSLHSMYSVVDYNTDWPSFANDFEVPVLLDPTTYSLDGFADIAAEQADGYSQQVVDTWRSIRESEQDHPSFTGEPIVVRAVAVLPVPPAAKESSKTDAAEGPAPSAAEFAVDFLPQISKTSTDIQGQVKRAYDVRLLVKGGENVGANYVKFDFGPNRQPVFADHQGKRAPLTVSRARAVPEGLPQSVDDLGLTPRSQGAIAMYIAPHIVKEKEVIYREPTFDSRGGMYSFGGGDLGPTKGLGGAHVDVGPASSWASSARRTDTIFDHVAPEFQGRPIIVSMQLLTFERSQ
jgi:hypothetical protein